MLEIGHFAKAIAFVWAIAFAKYSIWAKNPNYLKLAIIHFVFTLEEFCAKNRIKKKQRQKQIKKQKKQKQNTDNKKEHQVFQEKKEPLEKTPLKYSRNETMVIIAYLANAIAFA